MTPSGIISHTMPMDNTPEIGAGSGPAPEIRGEIARRLRILAGQGRITCPAALHIAATLGVSATEVGRAADALNLRISACQLGLFDKKCHSAAAKTPLRPDSRKGKRQPAPGAAHEIIVFKVSGPHFEEAADQVPAETSFNLVVNQEPVVSLLCTPTDLEAMAIGFLLSEGILERREQLAAIELQQSTVHVVISDLPENWQHRFHKKTVTSGCGQGITFTDTAGLRQAPFCRSPLRVPAATIGTLMQQFSRISSLFLATGGSHCAALSDGSNIIMIAEDIGRHNAVDKLIGKAFLNGIDLDDKILLSSGRVSGEIMTKMVRNRIPILVSRAAPTCMSVTHAEEHGITLIGFARGRRLNIYAHPQRISTTPCPPPMSLTTFEKK